MDFERRDNNWIQTFTGRRFWPLCPLVKDIDFEDIAHALSLKCRFTGHCREFYSVAQHSVIVSDLVPPELALWGLLHDATEAYLPDVARPVKPEIPEFIAIEDRLMAVIAEWAGMEGREVPGPVKSADLIALATERRDLLGAPPQPWKSIVGIRPREEVLRAASPSLSEIMFRSRAKALGFPARKDG